MRDWSGTLLAFVAWFIVIPESAFAQCSSHSLPSIPLSWEAGDGPSSRDHGGVPAMADVADLPRVPKPCTGEMCSGRPAMPVSPAPPQIVRVGVWAILEQATTIASMEQVADHPDQGNVRPTRCPALIFHPPRLSSILPIS